MLYYLDPHFLQDCTNNIEYYTNDIKKIPIDKLDPNVSFCFSIKNETDYKSIIELFDGVDGLPIKVVTNIKNQNNLHIIQTQDLDDEWLMID